MRVTEKEVIEQLWESADQYRPLNFIKFEEESLFNKGVKPDAIIEVSIDNGPSFKALIEIVSVATPKIVAQKCNSLLDYIRKLNRPDLVPVIVAPYIGKRQAKTLADEGVSWIDLCGNMMVQVSGTIYIERTGNKNKFPDTAPIKKIFQGNSSLISRALLLKPEGFRSQYKLVDFVNSRNANITASTVSRVLKSLEEELLIQKTKSLIKVSDAEKLLDRLTDAYINSGKRKEIRAYKFLIQGYPDLLWTLRRLDCLACGFYAAKLRGLAETDQYVLFIRRIEQAIENFNKGATEIAPDAEFGNLNFIETKDPCVWFNPDLIDEIPTVDNIELYLEMMADTPRGPKVAKLLKQSILKGQTN
jgi:hypothetical protein